MGVLRQALQGHPPWRVADQAFQLIAAMSGNIGVGVQRKAMYTSTTCAAQGGAFAFVAKA